MWRKLHQKWIFEKSIRPFLPCESNRIENIETKNLIVTELHMKYVPLYLKFQCQNRTYSRLAWDLISPQTSSSFVTEILIMVNTCRIVFAQKDKIVCVRTSRRIRVAKCYSYVVKCCTFGYVTNHLVKHHFRRANLGANYIPYRIPISKSVFTISNYEWAEM